MSYSSSWAQAAKEQGDHYAARSDSASGDRPRLLFVTNVCWYFVSHRLPLAVAAREAGYEVHVAAAEDATAAIVRDQGIHFHDLTFSRAGTHLFEEVRILGNFIRLFRRLCPDIVHLVTIKPVLYGGVAARVTKVGAVVSAIPGLGYVFLQKGARGRALRTAVGHAYRFALGHRNQRVIFQNRDDRQVFVRLRLVEPRQTVLIKGSGVDPAVFAPAPVVHPNATPLVILASRLLWDKGVGEFVEAARLLRQEQVQARFILVGNTDPNPSSVPERTLQAWHASGVVEWWGHQARMRDVFAQADIACLPSYREGLPKVLIEAAASGLPIVTTDVPGCRDICKDGENGLLVPAANAGALADALRSLLHDPARRDVMGRRGRELFLKEFTLDRVVSQTLTVYRDLLKQPGQEAGL